MTEEEAYKWAAQAIRAVDKLPIHKQQQLADSVASAILAAYKKGLAVYADLLSGWEGYGWKNGQYVDDIQEFFDDHMDVAKDPWVSVKDRLPEIPEGKHGISVLVAEFDHVYEEICPGFGYSVYECLYMKITDEERKRWQYCEDIKADFMTSYGGGGESFFGPPGDPIMYWMPMPAPPKREVKNGQL